MPALTCSNLSQVFKWSHITPMHVIQRIKSQHLLYLAWTPTGLHISSCRTLEGFWLFRKQNIPWPRVRFILGRWLSGMRMLVDKFWKQCMWGFLCLCISWNQFSPVGFLSFCWFIESLLNPMFSTHCHVTGCTTFCYSCVCLCVSNFILKRIQFVCSAYDSYRFLKNFFLVSQLFSQ